MIKFFLYSVLIFFLTSCLSKPFVQKEELSSDVKPSSQEVLPQALLEISQKSPNAPLRVNQVIEKIAFGSCMDQNLEQPIWKSLIKEEPNIFLGLGDLVYASHPSSKPMSKSYLEQINKNPELNLFRQRVPWVGIWDDHDFGINDGGGDHPEFNEAKQLFLAFIPNSAKVISPKQKGIYHSIIIGNKPKTLQIIFLDTRSYRSPLLPHSQPDPLRRYQPLHDPSATMLGEEQWSWLENEFLKPANVRILVSSIQVLSEHHGFEKWANIPHERSRLLNLIEKLKIKNLVIVSGDRHFSEVSKINLNKKHYLYEITSSSLNKAYPIREELNPLRVKNSAYFGANYGVMTIDYGKKRLHYQTKDVQGQAVYQIKIKLN